jgi:hypothetical protein
MKLFFEPPRIERIPGIASEWEAFVSRLADSQGEHSVTDNRQMADAVIHTWADQLNESTVRTLLRPLSLDDLTQLVWDWEDWPTGRMTGFYCSLQRGLYDPRRHRTTSYPIVFNELVREFPQSEARFDFGFVGGITAGVRERLVAMLKPTEHEDNSIIRAQGGVWAEACVRSPNESKLDYAEFLAHTRFVLCPRGFGVGSARLFETLKAGRVPVIISDGYVPPVGIDWDSCSIRIRENDVRRTREVVAASMDRWPSMAANARAVWERHFSDSNLLANLASGIHEMRATVTNVDLADKAAYAARITAAIVIDQAKPTLGRVKKALMDRLVTA